MELMRGHSSFESHIEILKQNRKNYQFHTPALDGQIPIKMSKEGEIAKIQKYHPFPTVFLV